MFETETDQKKCASCNFTSFYYSRRHSSCPPNQENRENSRLKNHKPGKSTVRSTSSGRLLLSDDEQLIESQEEIMTDQASPEAGKISNSPKLFLENQKILFVSYPNHLIEPLNFKKSLQIRPHLREVVRPIS